MVTGSPKGLLTGSPKGSLKTRIKLTWSTLPSQSGSSASSDSSGFTKTFTQTAHIYLKTFVEALATYLLSTLVMSMICVVFCIPVLVSIYWRMSRVHSDFYGDSARLNPSVFKEPIQYENISVAPVSSCSYYTYCIEPRGVTDISEDFKRFLFITGVLGPNFVAVGSMFGGEGLRR